MMIFLGQEKDYFLWKKNCTDKKFDDFFNKK